MNRTSKDIDSYMWSSSNHGSNSAPKNEDEGDFEHYSPQSFGKRASRHDSFILDAGEVRQTDEEPRNGHEKSWPTSVSGSTLTEASDTENVADLEQNVANDIPPTPAPFWSENLKSTRRVVFRKYVITLTILCIFVLGVLSIYWGALFRIKDNLHSVTIAVVDFDGQVTPYTNTESIVGPFVVAAIREAGTQPHALGYTYHHASAYNYDPLAVRRAVHSENLWGAIIISPNATSLLRSAVEHGNTTYDPKGACAIVYNQARDVESYNQYIIPTLLRLSSDITSSFGEFWTQYVLNNSTLSSSIYSTTPQALSPGISFTIYDIRPFDPPVAIPAVSIGLIYLIIIAFFSFSFFMPIHSLFLNPTTPSFHPPLKFWHLLLFRYLSTITAYFFLSLSYSLVSLAFQIPFSNTSADGSDWPTDEPVSNANLLGSETFPAYWALNFVGMTALGLPLETLAALLSLPAPSGPTSPTAPYTSLFLIFWVITNVSTGFYALELAPGFYRWGYIWPLRQIVMGSRALLFGTRSELGRNFGVLVAWWVVSSVGWVGVAVWGRWWKGRRAAREAKGGRGGGADDVEQEKTRRFSRGRRWAAKEKMRREERYSGSSTGGFGAGGQLQGREGEKNGRTQTLRAFGE